MDKRQKHESYGLISFSRTTSSGNKPLFGSSIEHSNTIRMRLKHAEVERGLNTDWYRSTGQIVEVEMSSAQFADLITSLNQGEGVPCTIRWLDGQGRIEDPPFESKAELHKEEFAKHQNKVKEELTETMKLVEETFKKKNLNKTDKEMIINNLSKLYTDIIMNSKYQVEMFDEQMAKTVTEAKAEIEAFVQNRMIIYANKALVENQEQLAQIRDDSINMISLEEKKDE